jgi:predicted ATP-grasp superfamily ATP-dependent carboligase
MVDRKIQVFVYETTSADPLCVDAALVSQGRSMRNAMLADLAMLDDVVLTCAVADAANAGLPSRVQAQVHPRPLPDATHRHRQSQEFLRQAARTHDLVWVVAPETDGLLESLRSVVADRQWIGCSRQAIRIAGSKKSTVMRLQAAGIATPESIASPGSIEASRASGNLAASGWVVKPDDGCGAAGVRLHAELAGALDDREQRRRLHKPATVEAWVDGEPLSITLLCSANETEVLGLNRQRISIDESGMLRFDGVCIGPVPAERRGQLVSLAGRLRKAMPGLAGIVGVDLVWHPALGPIVIEVNPRLTCAYEGLSAMLGRNLAAELLALHRRDWPCSVSAPVARTAAPA